MELKRYVWLVLIQYSTLQARTMKSRVSHLTLLTVQQSFYKINFLFDKFLKFKKKISVLITQIAKKSCLQALSFRFTCFTSQIFLISGEAIAS